MSDTIVGHKGIVWQHRIIDQIRTTLDTGIVKEPAERVPPTPGYDNDKNTLRREFASDTNLDELEAAGCLMETGEGHGRHELRQEQGPILGTLVGAAQIQDRVEAKSDVEESNREAQENSFITTR